MRPLELRLQGFRSYRAERTIPFHDMDIVAIIGDTGAGKSSLLEAMTWALYGASTWSKKSSTDLLAHGAKRMSVSLEFEAAGERWLVTRSFARSSAGTAELECLSNSGIAKVDGVRQVDPEIERILGLTYDVFCSCVLLPQGKFERLLKATPGEKTETLRSILRLEQIGEVRAVAERYAGIVGERERELIVARGRFREDPAADAAAAAADLERLEPELERLREAGVRSAALAEAARQHETEDRESTEKAERLTARRGTYAETLRQLETAHTAAAEEIARARSDHEAAEATHRAVDEEHADARQRGIDAPSLAALRARLEPLPTVLDRRARANQQVAKALNEVQTATARRAAAQGQATSTASSLTDHDEETSSAIARAEAAEGAYAQAVEATTTINQARDAVEKAAAGFAEAERLVTSARERRAEVTGRLELARQALQGARAEREEQLRANAAAHVAASCSSGEPCPVCDRALPEDFVPAAVPDLAAADAACARAEGIERQAAADERDAASAERSAADQASIAATALSSARDNLSAARDIVTTLPGFEAGEEPSTALARLEAAAATVRKEATSLDAARGPLDDAAREARESVVRAEGLVASAERDLEGRRKDRAQVIAELQQAIANVPPFSGLPPDPEALETADVDAALAAVGEREASAEELQRRRDSAHAAADRAADHVRDLERAYEREVLRPVAAAHAGVKALIGELPEEELGDLPPAESVADLAAFAALLETRVDACIAAVRAQSGVARAARERDTLESRRVLEATGFDTAEALSVKLDELRAQVLQAKHEHAAATAQVEDAATVTALVKQATEMRAGFEALKDVLSDGKFVRFVVSRRQRALLAHASRVLEEITGRYAFTDDFRILDRDSGLPRSPDTLSGGETFIASLALALGLVEVADRSGGDLRALFLDEGFGTLDATILDTALTALEERAKAGRLIGIISHVPAVAERIDTVLEVRNAVEGSDIAVLTAAERETRVLESAADAVATL